MDNTIELTLEQILGMQAIALLHEAGIANLRVETDGSISGQREIVRGTPQLDYLKNIRLKIEGSKIVISGNIAETVDDNGKII